jgi:hypothetical protein
MKQARSPPVAAGKRKPYDGDEDEDMDGNSEQEEEEEEEEMDQVGDKNATKSTNPLYPIIAKVLSKIGNGKNAQKEVKRQSKICEFSTNNKKKSFLTRTNKRTRGRDSALEYLCISAIIDTTRARRFQAFHALNIFTFCLTRKMIKFGSRRFDGVDKHKRSWSVPFPSPGSRSFEYTTVPTVSFFKKNFGICILSSIVLLFFVKKMRRECQ